MKVWEWMDLVLAGKELSVEEALIIYHSDFKELCSCADTIRQHFCGNGFDLCTIINGKSGLCSEDCNYCAQSVHHVTCGQSYPVLGTESLKKEALYNQKKGVLRYSVVTSGKRLDKKEIDTICESYEEMSHTCGISLCGSHGLLDYEDFCKLKKAGVTRYHNNLETSRRFFPFVCTTHTFDEKVATIQAAQEAGLEVCSGGILGLGETIEDRMDMAVTLRELKIHSVPVNVLNPIKGTPFGKNIVLSEEEVCRTVAVFRFLLPSATIRLAGGRGLFADQGRRMFQSGANAAITGDLLTTTGYFIDSDKAMLKELGYEVKKNG